MVSHLFFYQLMLIALVWLCLMLHWLWPSEPAAERLTTAPLIPPSRTRAKGHKPFPGLPRQPHCDACAQDVTLRREPPCPPPPRLISIRGRRRQVDTSRLFVPTPIVAMAAGLISATSSRMAIPAVAPGGNSIVAAVVATFLRPRARRCMANVSHPTRWGGASRRLPEGSASAPSRVSLRLIPTRCC